MTANTQLLISARRRWPVPPYPPYILAAFPPLSFLRLFLFTLVLLPLFCRRWQPSSCLVCSFPRLPWRLILSPPLS